MVKIKELPKMERPREKALHHGIDSLSNIELLALLISKGTKDNSAIDIAMNMLIKSEGIQNVNKLTYDELISINGINQVKALFFLGIFELTKRINANIEYKSIDINFLKSYFQNIFQDTVQEKFYLILLNYQNQLLFIKELFAGSENSISFSSKVVLSCMIKYNAKKFYLIHNHPLGNPTPSNADIEVTQNVIVLGLGIGCIFQDHIIFGNQSYYSYKKKQEFKY